MAPSEVIGRVATASHFPAHFFALARVLQCQYTITTMVTRLIALFCAKQPSTAAAIEAGTVGSHVVPQWVQLPLFTIVPTTIVYMICSDTFWYCIAAPMVQPDWLLRCAAHCQTHSISRPYTCVPPCVFLSAPALPYVIRQDPRPGYACKEYVAILLVMGAQHRGPRNAHESDAKHDVFKPQMSSC